MEHLIHSRTILYIVSIIAFLIGATVQMYADPYLPAIFSNLNKGYEKGYEKGKEAGFTAAKDLVKNSDVGRMYASRDDVRSLSGIVTEVTDDSFTLRVSVTDPFEDPALSARTVRVTSMTSIVKLTEEEQEGSNSKTSSSTPEQSVAEIMISPLVQSAAIFSDIAVGDALFVTAEENIRTAREFPVSEIQIQARAQ